jgi:hypothetical protein
MQWLNSTTAEVFIWDEDKWVEMPSGSGGGLWTDNGDDIYYNKGNVGIGETNPQRNIDVRDATNASMVLKVTGASQFNFINDGTTADIGVTNSKDLTFSTGSNGDAERMRIGADGKVDVGEIRVPRSMDNIFVGSFGPSLSDDSAVVIENSGGMRSSLTLTSSNSAEFSGRVIADDIEGVRFYRKATGGLTIGSGSIIPVNQSGVAENNLISLGTAAYKWKQVHAVTTRSSSFIQDGSPVIDAKGLINTLSTLHRATMDETKDIRESLRSAIEELVEGFEQEIATMPAGDSE